MSKTLYLHVGMPKCASTTIQGVLRAHAELFAEHGKFYGIPPHDTTERQGNVAVMLADIRAGRNARVRDALSFFLERDTDVIMSSEMFIGLARNNLAEQLVERAQECGFEVRLICYVRRQDHWIESDYKQHIKGGSNWDSDIHALLNHRRKNKVLDYSWMIGNWARSIPIESITIVPLQRGQSDYYPIERFLQFMNMDPELAPKLAVDRQNVSPAVGLIEPARYLKLALRARGMPPSKLAKPLYRFLEQAPTRIEVPERRFLLNHQSRSNLVAKYAESNTQLGRTFLNGLPPFNETIEEDAASEAPLATEAARLLAAWIAYDLGPLEKSLQTTDPAAPPSDSRPGQEGVAKKRNRWWFRA